MEPIIKSLGDNLIPVVAIILGVLVAGVTIVASAWRKVRLAEVEAALKQDLVNRGMSAEDIERIIKAKGADE